MIWCAFCFSWRSTLTRLSSVLCSHLEFQTNDIFHDISKWKATNITEPESDVDCMGFDVWSMCGQRYETQFVWSAPSRSRTLKENCFPSWQGDGHGHLLIQPSSIDHLVAPGPLFTKKTPSYGYRDPHDKPKTVWRPSQVYNGNPYTDKTASS